MGIFIPITGDFWGSRDLNPGNWEFFSDLGIFIPVLWIFIKLGFFARIGKFLRSLDILTKSGNFRNFRLNEHCDCKFWLILKPQECRMKKIHFCAGRNSLVNR